MAAFWKPNSKVLSTRQQSFITVSIVPKAVHRADVPVLEKETLKVNVKRVQNSHAGDSFA